MTSPDNSPSEPETGGLDGLGGPGASGPDAPGPQYADRAYRSMAGAVSGVLLLAISTWLVGDAVVRGQGRTPWLALASLLMIAPVVVAFTLRPVVLANEDRMLVRNPFRTITLPWAAVETVRAGYSTEAVAGGVKYQLWAIPVSLRQRKRASRQQARAAAEDPFQRTKGAAGGGTGGPARAWADAAVEELRELAERAADREAAAGEVSVRWAVEVFAPALAGAVTLLILMVLG